ncbi:MAG TPA: hypothetical protein VIM62_02140 [Acidobacteriaceae bacterium]
MFALVLICFWITSASFAEHAWAEFPLCQPDQAPCCPLPENNAPESCPACQVSIAAAQKEESKADETQLAGRSERASYFRADIFIPGARRELTPGLRYHPTVFQLKDDFRI